MREEQEDRSQKDQDRLQNELEFTCEGMVTASKELTSCWALHIAACADVHREVSNRRATHEAICAEVKKDRRSQTKRHGSAREDALPPRALHKNHQRAHEIRSTCLGFLGRCVEGTSPDTHTLTCGVPDRESNEIRYLKKPQNLLMNGSCYFKGYSQ